jgi:GNAT superfamily N-acetyltransferase
MLEDSPWAFGSDPADDLALDESRVAETLAQDENAILAIEEGSELVGGVGVARNRRSKFAHRAIVRAVFVEPAHRGQGLGAALLRGAIELARGWPGIDYVDLRDRPRRALSTSASASSSGAGSPRRSRWREDATTSIT